MISVKKTGYKGEQRRIKKIRMVKRMVT